MSFCLWLCFACGFLLSAVLLLAVVLVVARVSQREKNPSFGKVFLFAFVLIVVVVLLVLGFVHGTGMFEHSWQT